MSVLLLWMCGCFLCFTGQSRSEDVELFNSVKQTHWEWNAKPLIEWSITNLKLGSETNVVPVYQACTGSESRKTLLSQWFDHGEPISRLLLDIAFAQEEEEESEIPFPLEVHLFQSKLTQWRNGGKVLDLHVSRQFPSTAKTDEISSDYLNRSLALNLGQVTQGGFHLGFSYSGSCLFIATVRVYYRRFRCPGVVSDLVAFEEAGAGSGPQAGSCVEGAVEVSPPIRECTADGTWSPLQGACVCGPGRERVDNACKACRTGYYKAARGPGACVQCSPNSGTTMEGAEKCDCLHGYSRLQADPSLMGCTKPPSAPDNVTVRHHNDTLLTLWWDPPHDLGGRREVMYNVTCLCSWEGSASGRWEPCGREVVFLPASVGLTNTSVSVSGVNPHSDYRLSVQAWNYVSVQQRAASSSVSTVTIQKLKIPVIVTVRPVPKTITVSPVPKTTTAVGPVPKTTTAVGPVPKTTDPQVVPQEAERAFGWMVVGAVLGALLLLLAIILLACTRQRNKHTVLRNDNQDLELLTLNPGVSYRRPEQTHPEPPQPTTLPLAGVVQLLEGFSEGLLDRLKDVLVERDQLTLGKELGKGEFGAVYEGAFTPENGQVIKVAVKTMRVGIHSQEDLRDFLKEAEIMKNFDHDNVVRLLGVTLESEQDSVLPVPLVILPFMKHGDLRRFLIATRYGDIPMFVPHQSLLRFMIDIAEGMEYLSSQGFLHRDLAARNCMLGDDLRVSVADFGLSKNILSNNYYRQTVAIRVPIKWMAMESLSESIYTTKSDVWSFGVTIWEIVSRGRTPYPGVNNHELLDLLTSGYRLKPPDDCDSPLYEVMRSCWHDEPSQRPGFRELGEKLKGLLSQLPALEASQEAYYINQGLEAAASQEVTCCEDRPEREDREEGATGNVYLPAPTRAAPPPAKREVEEDNDEDGYLLSVNVGSAVKRDD